MCTAWGVPFFGGDVKIYSEVGQSPASVFKPGSFRNRPTLNKFIKKIVLKYKQKEYL